MRSSRSVDVLDYYMLPLRYPPYQRLPDYARLPLARRLFSSNALVCAPECSFCTFRKVATKSLNSRASALASSELAHCVAAAAAAAPAAALAAGCATYSVEMQASRCRSVSNALLCGKSIKSPYKDFSSAACFCCCANGFVELDADPALTPSRSWSRRWTKIGDSMSWWGGVGGG